MSDFAARYDGRLGTALGDLGSRLVTWSRQAFDGRTPPMPCNDNPLIPEADAATAEYRRALHEGAPDRARQSLWVLLAATDRYLAAREPDALIRAEGGSGKVSRILWNALETVRIVATALRPMDSQAAQRVLVAIGADALSSGSPPDDELAWGGMPTGVPLPPAEDSENRQPARVDRDRGEEIAMTEHEAAGEPQNDHQEPTGAGEAAADAPAPTPAPAAEPAATEEAAPAEDPRIGIEQFFETELRVARVTLAEAIPKSNKLLRLEVDLGDETRQLVAGVAKQYAPEDLVGRQVVIVANLKPAKLMGVESQGMVLAATDGGAPVLLQPDREVPVGSRVR